MRVINKVLFLSLVMACFVTSTNAMNNYIVGCDDLSNFVDWDAKPDDIYELQRLSCYLRQHNVPDDQYWGLMLGFASMYKMEEASGSTLKLVKCLNDTLQVLKVRDGLELFSRLENLIASEDYFRFRIILLTHYKAAHPMRFIHLLNRY